jgi:myo-inositol-1-phosphate synthase
MKSPHTQRPDDEARDATERFIAKYAGKPGTRPQGRRAPKKSATKAAAKAS